MYLTNSPDTLHKNFVLQMAHESAIVPSSNVKDGDESENEIDLEEGEIEDGELPEEGETRTFDHQETTVPVKIEQKLQQTASPVSKLEPRTPLLPLPTRHPNSTIKRRPPPQRNYNSRHIKEDEPEDDDWASSLERALAQKAALASENANAKIKHLTPEINEDCRNSHEDNVDDEDDDKKLRRKKRKKKFKDDEENDGEPKDSKRRRKSHHKRTDMSWECKDEDEDEDGDEDEMLFVRGASPTVRNVYHDDDDDSPQNFQEDSYSYSDQGEMYDESYGSYGEHKDDDDDDDNDFDIRGSFSRRGPRDDEDEDRHLNRGLKRRTRGSSIVRGGSDRMHLTKRLSSRRDGVVKPRGGKRSNSHGPQDRDSVCLFFMQGKCHRGNDCPYSHDAMPQKKLELCKFYLMDCCAKKDKCLYMHQSFPCKFYHTGMKCYSGSRCKFSHGKLTDQMKSILLKHLETSPKDCVGDFPRVNREGSTGMNYSKKSASRPNKPSSKKIPSLFDIEVPVYVQRMAEKKDVDSDEQSPPRRTTPMPESDVEDQEGQQTSVSSSPKTERRSSSRTKSSRWNKEDSPTYSNSRDGNSERTPDRKSKYNRDEIEDLGEKPILRFYQETLGSDEMDDKESCEKTFGESKIKRELNLHRLAGYSPKSLSDAEESQKLKENSLGITKANDNFDSKTMISTGIDGKRDKLDQAELVSDTRESQPETGGESGTDSNDGANIPLHLPKKQRELFLRIQQQQREADNSKDTTGENEDDEDNCRDENWYSSDDEEVPLTDVLKNLTQQEQQQKQEHHHLGEKQKEPKQSELSSIKDTIASCVAGVGFPDLSQIKISESVTKILSSIRHQAITPIAVSPSASISSATLDTTDTAQTEKLPSQLQSPTPVARDPRLSRDPRNRSTGAVGSCQGLASPTSTSEVSTPSARRQDPRSNRMDPRKSNASPGEEARASVGASRRGSFTSIYSNAITTPGDIDLRNLVPQQESRTADVDLRHIHDTDFRINYAAKDTDLRPKLLDDILSEADNSGHIGDVDLRRMLELPFKPVPMHTPATEIDASLTSHPPIPYKVVEVTIPRPDYTNLKLNTSDPQVENDPRLRKIFKLPTTTATTTNASTSKPTSTTVSPATSIAPRTDPRRLSARGRTHATTSSVSTPIPTPIITQTPQTINPETLPFPHQPEIPLHTGPLLPTPNMLPNMDPRILRGNTRNNSPGLLGAAPAGFCPSTPRFEEESDDSAIYQNSWNMHQAQRTNWRGGLRSQQARYMEQDFGNRQGLKSFTPPL